MKISPASLRQLSSATIVAASLCACSSDDGSVTTQAETSSRQISVVDALANANTNAPRFAISSDNATAQFWTNGSGGVANTELDEAGTSVGARVSFDLASTRPSLIEDTATGRYLVINERNQERVDFLVFGDDDLFLSGYTVQVDNSEYVTAPITGTPAFEGQLNGQLLSSPQTGSYALIAGEGAGLGASSALSADTATLIEALGGGSLANAGDDLTANLTWAGVLLGSSAARGLSPATHGAAGVAMLLSGFGASSVSTLVDSDFVTTFIPSQEIVDLALACLADRQTPGFAGAWDFIENEFATAGVFVNDVVEDAKSNLNRFTNFADADGINEGTLPDSFPSPADAPPAITVDLEGQGVFQDGTVYSLEGSIGAGGAFSCTGSTGDSDLSIDGSLIGTIVSGSFDLDGVGGTVDGSSRPFGDCDVAQQSGGQGTFTFAQFIGASQGTIQFRYQAFSIPDGFTVTTSEGVRFTTGGLVSGQEFIDIAVDNEPIVFVSVSAPQSGTAWNYTLGCIQ